MTPLAGSWQIVCAAKAVARSRIPCASARFVKSGGLRARQQSAARSTSMDFIAVLESPVSESSGHGQTLAALRLAHSPTLTTQTLKKTMVAVSRCKLEVPNHGPTSPIPVQDAYMIVLQIGPPSRRELWLDGKAKRTEPLTPGEVAFHDLRRQPAFKMYTPVDSLNFHIPRLALDACTDDADTGRIGDLNFKPGIGVNDVTLAALAEALLPAFNYPDQVSQLFLDHVTVAIVAHVAHAFGGMRELARAARGGLAPWQARRATEFLEANLDGNISVAQLANTCRLSVSQFSRAFRQLYGIPPHQWLLQRRIERAMQLLRDPAIGLADVAMACGFADQSHFTRVFTRMLGAGPGAWRRAQAD